jgi:hypothetical protein
MENNSSPIQFDVSKDATKMLVSAATKDVVNVVNGPSLNKNCFYIQGAAKIITKLMKVM